jgi:protein tyrosine phosphatase (PTP) superfamily phosphohydrolase (DUF442 family)
MKHAAAEGAGDAQPVSNAFVDIAFACAAHAEHRHRQGPAQSLQRIDDDIFVAGQFPPSADMVKDVQRMGIQTVFNIRRATEDGYVDLQKEFEEQGIAYERCPVDYQEPNEKDVDHLLGRLDACRKPCLLICEVGLRAAAMGIAFKSARARSALALQGGLGSGARCLLSEDDAKLLEGLSRDPEEDSQFKTFIASYVASKVNNCLKRPSSSKVCDNVFLAGQLSEDEIREFATKEGCKSVLNLCQPGLGFRVQDEAGQFGLGMLAKEKEVVEAMGIKYINVPVPREGTYDIELCQKVSNALME